MELPKSKAEFLVAGSKIVLRLPFLYLSFRKNHPINVSPLSVEANITDRCNFIECLCEFFFSAFPEAGSVIEVERY